jgi:membrane protease YdiL (CAAX protease family)
MKRLLRYFGGIVPFFAAVGFQLVLAEGFLIFYNIISTFTGKSEIGAGTETDVPQNLWNMVSIAIILATGVLFFFWYRFLIRGEVQGNLQKLFSAKNISMFILLGLGCQSFLTGLMSLIEPFFTDIFTDYSETIDQIMSGNTIVILAFTVFIAPISEELIFRGVILHKSSLVLPFLGANLLQALLFGLYHMNIVQGIYGTLAGFLLGLIYHKFRTIFAPILLHMMINASSFLIMYAPNNTISMIVLIGAGAVLLVISFILLKTAENGEPGTQSKDSADRI